MSTQTTKIRVGKEYWDVPRGFGVEYSRHVEFADDHDTLIDLLGLIGYSATKSQIVKWDLRRRVEASVYAANVHARASDNPVQRHPPLSWLPAPWKGPQSGDGVFAGPTPTVIP